MTRAGRARFPAFSALLSLGALDAVGYGVIAPVVPEISDKTGAGPGVMGVLVASFAGGMLVGYPLAGRIVRRRGASTVLVLALALTALGDLGFILGDGLAAYFPARIVQGVGAGGLWIGVVFGILERWPGQEYKRLTVLLAAFSVGGVAGPGLGAVGGIRGPFALHLGLVLASALVLLAAQPTQKRPTFESDRATLRHPGFLLSALGVLAIAVSVGTLEGPLPLHFASHLGQGEIGALYIGASILLGASATVAGRLRARPMLLLSLPLMTVGLAAAGAANDVAVWILAAAVAAIGFGVGQAGTLGILLESIGVKRIVLAMVVWSQAWGAGYLAGPAIAGGVAQALGFKAIGLIPLAASLLVLAVFPRALLPAPLRDAGGSGPVAG